MISDIKSFARSLCPPIVADALRRSMRPEKSPVEFKRGFDSWGAAMAASTGYDSPAILKKTREAILKVKRGDAAFERDSLSFDAMEWRFPLLAGLLRAAASDGGRLSVLDFGGSLGTSYFQCRGFLAPVKDIEWSIVEQAAHVDIGNREFADDVLKFFPTIDACCAERAPKTILLSGVLQYLSSPDDILRSMFRLTPGHIIVDRTIFAEDGRRQIVVQHVPEWIYKASMPAWLLNETDLTATFAAAGYRIAAEFPTSKDAANVYYKGFIFEATR